MANTSNGNGKSNDGSAIQAWFLKTAAAIIGGLGTAGAMVVIGSAILWVRFKEVRIPAVQAVSVQPKQEALVQGAQTTIFFVFAAVAVVVVLYISDFRKESEQGEEADRRSNKEKRKTDPDPGVKREIEPRTRKLLGLVPIAGIVWVIFWTSLGFWWVVWLSGLAMALWYACSWIGRCESKNFWALAAAVFAAVIVFSGVAEYAIVQSQKFVQAVAILRGKDDTGLTGYYVAVTDKKIYFANAIGVEGAVKPIGKPLQEAVLNDEVTYSVGPLENQEDATLRASTMLKKLISDREGNVGGGLTASHSSLPAWVPSNVAATFGGSVQAHIETPESLCLMRYFGSEGGTAKGPWWTSCKEAEAEVSIEDVRAQFALPRRFQANYDRRARVEVPAKAKLDYVEGDTAPQCGGEGSEPCGYKYPGGGIQYWIVAPDQLGQITEECTTTKSDQDSAWHSCKG